MELCNSTISKFESGTTNNIARNQSNETCKSLLYIFDKLAYLFLFKHY